MVCLYCPAAYSETTDLLHHMKVVHGFDFVSLRTELGLHFYQQVGLVASLGWHLVLQVKLINYIRRMVHLGCCTGCSERFPSKDGLVEHLAWAGHHTPASPSDWDQPQYYFPTYENDNLLFGLEDPDAGEEVEVTAEDVALPEGSILAQEEVRRGLAPARRRGGRGVCRSKE
jgi:hypothetical protein